MSDSTKISWSEATWNVVSGCTRVSAGCDHCYIERTPPFRINHRRFDKPGIGGTTGVMLHGDRLFQPFGWKRPRRIFVCSLADLFHDQVPDLHIAKTWATMARTPQHRYQVLTKRPARMRSLLRSHDFELMVEAVCSHHDFDWPLPNVWGGTTAEDQPEADRRIPILLDTPLAVRWVSVEPMLGPVDLDQPRCDVHGRNFANGPWCTECAADGFSGELSFGHWLDPLNGGISWVVCGGESGPGARPMHPDWARSLRDQCADAGVAYHFKQWGEHVVPEQMGDDVYRRWEATTDENFGTDRPQRVGKKAAGRLLDGVLHDAYPAAVTS